MEGTFILTISFMLDAPTCSRQSLCFFTIASFSVCVNGPFWPNAFADLRQFRADDKATVVMRHSATRRNTWRAIPIWSYCQPKLIQKPTPSLLYAPRVAAVRWSCWLGHNSWHTEAETRWLSLCKGHIPMHCRNSKCLNFDWICTEVCCYASNRWSDSIGSGNGLAPNWRQAITGTNDDTFHRWYAWTCFNEET